MSEKATHRGWVTVALLLSMFMTAIEITIVATAMPRIVSDLGGFALLSWVFSSYLLTQVVSIPIYGKLADLYGRKPVLLAGITIFLIASFLCGQATSMVQLIAYRFLQGVGGGAVQPSAVTIIGDLFEPKERHRIQGWIGSVFAISSLVGPGLGALIVEWGHWPWIFYLNLPLGLGSMFIISKYLHEKRESKKHQIDYAGTLLLITGTSLLMLGLLEGGTAWPWGSWQSLSTFAGALAFLLLLLKVESKTEEPILPLWIFRHKLISIAGIATFLNGALMIGYSAMIPTHVQGVLGKTPLVAGLTLAAMSIGWPLASFCSGKVMGWLGYKKSAVLGAAALLTGSIGVYFTASADPIAIGSFIFVIGMGLGLQSNAYVITIQSKVPWKERGVATANNLFMRTLGSSVGVAAFGGVLNSTISGHLGKNSVKFSGEGGLDLINQLLDPEKVLSTEARLATIKALGMGMNAVFVAAILTALVCIICTLFLPAEVESRS